MRVVTKLNAAFAEQHAPSGNDNVVAKCDFAPGLRAVNIGAGLQSAVFAEQHRVNVLHRHGFLYENVVAGYQLE